MKYHKVCPICGHITTSYLHNLSQPLVSALYMLVGVYEKLKRPLNLQNDLELTKNQYNNFQKLQYFFLVKDIPGKGWVPTERGTDFIYGNIAILDKAITFGREILPKDHEAWKGVKYGMVYVQDIDVKCWKKKVEYQLEKTRQLSF